MEKHCSSSVLRPLCCHSCYLFREENLDRILCELLVPLHIDNHIFDMQTYPISLPNTPFLFECILPVSSRDTGLQYTRLVLTSYPGSVPLSTGLGPSSCRPRFQDPAPTCTVSTRRRSLHDGVLHRSVLYPTPRTPSSSCHFFRQLVPRSF